MTQIWKDGKVVPVTVVHAEPNKVSILRTANAMAMRPSN